MEDISERIFPGYKESVKGSKSLGEYSEVNDFEYPNSITIYHHFLSDFNSRYISRPFHTWWCGDIFLCNFVTIVRVEH